MATPCNHRLRMFQPGFVACNRAPGYSETAGGPGPRHGPGRRRHFKPGGVVNMEDSKTLGARIQAHRRRMGLSQEQLAERLGVSRQAVSKWELDESLPELDKALALCRVFGVSADMLLQGCEEPRPACPAGAAPQRRLMPAFGAALVVLGLVYICTAWYERQLATDIAIGMAIQALGLILQGAAGLFEKASGHRRLWRANFALCTFVPVSLLVTVLMRGYPRPYFSFGVLTLGGFFLVYGAVNAWFWWKTRG